MFKIQQPKYILMQSKTVIISDLEGPWSLADHAYESLKLIPNGAEIYRKLSSYDDYMYLVRKRAGYEPGNTLVLMAPFLIAQGITENDLMCVAAENQQTVGCAGESLSLLAECGHTAYLISTSYSQYVDFMASVLGIPYEMTRSTQFPLDILSAGIAEDEKQWVRETAGKIAGLPELSISPYSSDERMSEDDIYSTDRMGEFFWEYLPKTGFSRVFEEVRPLGGKRKTDAALSIMEKECIPYENAVFVGDSITDAHMLREARERGGLAVSFNGNEFCLGECDIAIVSRTATPSAVICDIYSKAGRDDLESIVCDWGIESLREACDHGMLDRRLFAAIAKESLESCCFPEAYVVEVSDFSGILERSIGMRKSIRGGAGCLS